MPDGVFIIADRSEAKLLADRISSQTLPGSVLLSGMNLLDITDFVQAAVPDFDAMSLVTDSFRVGYGAGIKIPDALDV